MFRWVMRKMNFEFAELLQTTSGKLLAHIIVSCLLFVSVYIEQYHRIIVSCLLFVSVYIEQYHRIIVSCLLFVSVYIEQYRCIISLIG